MCPAKSSTARQDVDIFVRVAAVTCEHCPGGGGGGVEGGRWHTSAICTDAAKQTTTAAKRSC